jgi:hypothetical protein
MDSQVKAYPWDYSWIIPRMEDWIIPSAWKTWQVTHTYFVVGIHLGD